MYSYDALSMGEGPEIWARGDPKALQHIINNQLKN